MAFFRANLLGFLFGLMIVSTLLSHDAASQDAASQQSARELQKDAFDEKLHAEKTLVEKPLVIGSTFQLKSKILKSDRQVNVWLPPSYSKGDARYPVLYVIDGGLDQDFQHLSGLAQLATINASFDELIVVGIRTQNRIQELCQKQLDPRYLELVPSIGKSDEFMSYISDEVLPSIEKRYRTGKRRAVVGESLGGLFVAEVFLRRPTMFTDYISISPSLWWDDRALAKASPDLLAKHDQTPRKIYFSMANEGGTMQAGLDSVMEAIRSKKDSKIEMFYVDRSKTEIHSTIYHPATHDALLKLFGKPRPEFGKRPWYLIEGGQPEEKKK